MAENITTLNEIRERTLAAGFTPDINDIVSVDHGTGSKRHRAFTLAEIAALIAGGSLNPIVLEGSGGGEHYTLTINHNSITCVKSATGGASVTTKIDFIGESILPTVSVDTLKANTLHGTTPVGVQSYKLVIDTITEILGNVIIGASDDKKDVAIHGNLNLDGKFVSDVTVGLTNAPADLSVTGSTTLHGNVFIDSDKRLRVNSIMPMTNNGTVSIDSPVSIGGDTTFGSDAQDATDVNLLVYGAITAKTLGVTGTIVFGAAGTNRDIQTLTVNGKVTVNGVSEFSRVRVGGEMMYVCDKTATALNLDTYFSNKGLASGDVAIVMVQPDHTQGDSVTVNGTGLSNITVAKGTFKKFIYYQQGSEQGNWYVGS